MFNKNKCPRCNSRVNKDFDFCPYCRTQLKKTRKQDWGMLGKNDFLEEESQDMFGFPGFGGNMLGKMLNNAMKMLEKEFQKENQNTPRTQMRMSVNGQEIDLNKLFQNKQKPPQQTKQKTKQTQEISKENLAKLSKLPRADPETKIKRLGNKIIYELKTPGLKSTKDILFIKLENSVEIKAIAKNKVYVKRIPIKAPLMNYEIIKDNLILEFKAQR